MTQLHRHQPFAEQTADAVPDRGDTARGGGWEQGQDTGFDDMNIPGWSDYAAARAAALGRLSRPGRVRVESSPDR